MATEFNVSFVIGAVLGSGLAASFKTAQRYLSQTKEYSKSLASRERELMGQQTALNEAVKNGTINMSSYQNAMKQVSAGLRAVEGDKLKEQFSQLGEQRQRAFVKAAEWGGITYALAKPIRDAMKFESAMADVSKVVNMTGDEFKEMRQDIIDMSKRIPMTAEEISKIVAAGGQAGLDKNELLEFAEDAAKMGVAFDISAEQAGDMMAKWRTAFKMSQEDVFSLADKINYLGDTTAASADKISDVVTRIGPLGEVGGVASGEIAALGASMVSTGVESEVAATGIKNMILGMTAGESATSTQADAFSKLGLNATEMAKRMQVDAKGAILDVLSALKNLDESERASTLKDLFGKESIGAIAPLISNLDAVRDNFEKVGESGEYAGSVNQEFANRAATAENSMILLKNAVNGLSIELGNSLVPMVTSGVKGITEFMEIASKAMSACPGLASAVYGITIGFSALVAVGSAVKFMLILGKQAAVGFRIVLHALNVVTMIARAGLLLMTAAQWALNTAFAANPIGFVVAALIILIGVIYAVYTHFEEVQEFCASMWESPAAAVVAFLAGPIGWLIYAGMGIIANWDEVKAWFVLLWEDPQAALSQFCDYVTSQFGGLFDWIASKWDWIKSVFSTPITATIIGEASANGQVTSIEENAQGGIYGRGAFLTTFAEDSAEAAIPLDGSSRALSLYRQTGKLLGVDSVSNGTVINASFSPTIYASNNTDVTGVRQALRDSEKRFEEMLERLANTRRRKAYE